MAAVSETIVREFFELSGFLVRQRRKYVAPSRREDEEIDFFVYNPQPATDTNPLPFVLELKDIPRVARAVVVVKGWHTGIFSPNLLTHTPEIFRFLEPGVFKQAARQFGGDGSISKILIVPALPQNPTAREQSIALLRAKGIDAVMEFRTLLAGLITRIEVNRNYQKSDLLQIIRLLKNYDFIKDPQLELFRPAAKKRRRKAKAEASAPATDQTAE
ncbi:MAG: hypothetical protein AB1813_11115 [Verrucomicrobiota bacterium]